MSYIQVVSQTQQLVVTPGTQTIVFNPSTESVIVQESVSSVGIINAGPPGPPGAPGSVNMTPVIEEIDTRIATHNQSPSPIHDNATSGRDFVALFQNGLV